MELCTKNNFLILSPIFRIKIFFFCSIFRLKSHYSHNNTFKNPITMRFFCIGTGTCIKIRIRIKREGKKIMFLREPSIKYGRFFLTHSTILAATQSHFIFKNKFPNFFMWSWKVDNIFLMSHHVNSLVQLVKNLIKHHLLRLTITIHNLTINF